jgi:hypothetical protein
MGCVAGQGLGFVAEVLGDDPGGDPGDDDVVGA